jgi:AcrR family transcriptional regulator
MMGYTREMPRSAEPVRRRLQIAALDLYRKQGYEATTAADIAAAAGVTERTFFRHFPDKRDVLFYNQTAFRTALAKAITDVPPGTAAPLAVLRQASRAVVSTLEEIRPFAQPRWELVAATPALRERELTNFALLQDVSAEALMARGVPERQATLAAQVGVAALGQAIRDWMPDPGADFDALLTEAFDDLSELVRRRRRPA